MFPEPLVGPQVFGCHCMGKIVGMLQGSYAIGLAAVWAQGAEKRHVRLRQAMVDGKRSQLFKNVVGIQNVADLGCEERPLAGPLFEVVWMCYFLTLESVRVANPAPALARFSWILSN